MANYESCIRTNYFHVNDPEGFKKYMRRVYGTEDSVELWEEQDAEGKPVFGFGTMGGIGGVNPEDENAEEVEDSDYDAVINDLQTFVADGDAIIILECGHEKLRYIVGSALVITKDQCESLDIAHLAASLAAKLLGDPNWCTRCEY